VMMLPNPRDSHLLGGRSPGRHIDRNSGYSLVVVRGGGLSLSRYTPVPCIFWMVPFDYTRVCYIPGYTGGLFGYTDMSTVLLLHRLLLLLLVVVVHRLVDMVVLVLVLMCHTRHMSWR
jgi:hypothetical protein